MTAMGWLQILFFFVVLLALTKPTGVFLCKVFQGERTFLTPVFAPVERLVYRMGGIDPEEDMPWTRYTLAMLLFSIVALVVSYLVLRLQGILPLNPAHLSTGAAPSWGTAMTPDLAFNTAASFTTNTNWQAYSGENTVSYFSQMVALTSHNFFSAATGIAIAIALVRGLARRSAQGIGNFWADITRATLYVLLPLSIILALFYVQHEILRFVSDFP